MTFWQKFESLYPSISTWYHWNVFQNSNDDYLIFRGIIWLLGVLEIAKRLQKELSAQTFFIDQVRQVFQGVVANSSFFRLPWFHKILFVNTFSILILVYTVFCDFSLYCEGNLVNMWRKGPWKKRSLKDSLIHCTWRKFQEI